MQTSTKETLLKRHGTIAEFSNALSHPARVAILTLLAEKRDCVCGEIVLKLPLAQSTISQHLKVLKEIGLIKGSIEGPSSRYCIDWKVFDAYRSQFLNWSERFDRLRKENQC